MKEWSPDGPERSGQGRGARGWRGTVEPNFMRILAFIHRQMVIVCYLVGSEYRGWKLAWRSAVGAASGLGWRCGSFPGVCERGLIFGAGRVSARRPTHLLLRAQEKVSKEKGSRRQGPALRYGCLALLAPGGVWRQLALRAQTTPALILPPLRCSALPPRRGRQTPKKQGRAMARPCGCGSVSAFYRRSEEASRTGVSGSRGARLIDQSLPTR